MKTYRVRLSAEFEVDASNEDEAIDVAYEKVIGCEENLFVDDVEEVK